MKSLISGVKNCPNSQIVYDYIMNFMFDSIMESAELKYQSSLFEYIEKWFNDTFKLNYDEDKQSNQLIMINQNILYHLENDIPVHKSGVTGNRDEFQNSFVLLDATKIITPMIDRLVSYKRKAHTLKNFTTKYKQGLDSKSLINYLRWLKTGDTISPKSIKKCIHPIMEKRNYDLLWLNYEKISESMNDNDPASLLDNYMEGLANTKITSIRKKLFEFLLYNWDELMDSQKQHLRNAYWADISDEMQTEEIQNEQKKKSDIKSAKHHPALNDLIIPLFYIIDDDLIKAECEYNEKNSKRRTIRKKIVIGEIISSLIDTFYYSYLPKFSGLRISPEAIIERVKSIERIEK